ncbi:hypothetical protein PW035_53225, partial [Nonomuraea angiospora]|nr:hypothetical protein [Nonomuraea angiospora]
MRDAEGVGEVAGGGGEVGADDAAEGGGDQDGGDGAATVRGTGEVGTGVAGLEVGGAAGADDFDEGAIPALLRVAAADPDGFKLLFRYAAREPDFRDLIDSITAASREVGRRNLARVIPEGPWLDWVANLIPSFTLEAVIAWLDAGQPDPSAPPTASQQPCTASWPPPTPP